MVLYDELNSDELYFLNHYWKGRNSMFGQGIEFGSKIEGVHYKERIGVYALIPDSDSNIALIKTGRGYFLPGGGIEGNETHEECLKRECSEEMGYNVMIGDYIGQLTNYTVSFKNNEYLKVVGHVYIAKLLDINSLKTEEDHELIWVPIKESVDKMYIEFQSYAIKNYIEQQKIEHIQ